MDVITLSSDSEDSNIEESDSKRNSNPTCLANWNNENYSVGWNGDEDAHPPINYVFKSPKIEVAQHLNYLEEIEEVVTPVKPNENFMIMDFTVNDDGETVPYKNIIEESLPSASDLKTSSQSSNCKSSKTRPTEKLSQEEKEKEKMLKIQKKLEKEQLREQKKIEQQKQKALKAAFFENQRKLKPEENIKFLKVHIDNDIINSPFGGNIISLLQESNIQYVVEPQRKNSTVTWSKKKVKKVVDDFGEVTDNIEIAEENILIYMLEWEMAVELIYKNELLSHVEMVKSAYFDKKLTVVICGMKKYFNYKKNKRNNDIKAVVIDKRRAKPKNGERIFEEAHNITKDLLEFALIDLQVIGKHNCRLLETSDEFSAFILNITKSLSLIDYKLEKQKRQINDFGWISNDSHQSVKVDKNGIGLLRLWQQQICQFNSVGMETAQAIVSQYNSPLALINQYKNIDNNKDKELLLQNIQIRREAGILSTSRRIGPQLSKKIYKFFTTDDPDAEL